MKILSRLSTVSDIKNVKIPTGIQANKKSEDIFDAIFGQLSDGLWENSPRMEKFWKGMNIETSGGEIVVTVSPSLFVWDFDKQPDKVLKWLAVHLKQIIKEEGCKWDRKNTEVTEYITYDSEKNPITVQDCYKVYDALLKRKPRIFEE